MDLVPDFHLISSTRYDPCLLALAWNTDANDGVPSPFLLLRYHLDRLNCAAKAHSWIVSLSYQDLLVACEDAVRNARSASAGAVSLKVLVDTLTLALLTFSLAENSIRPPRHCHCLGRAGRATVW